MFTLTNAIILASSLSFMGFIVFNQKTSEIAGLYKTQDSANSMMKLFYIFLGLVPLYFLHQSNSVLLTILKFIGINILNMFVFAILFKRSTVSTISLISVVLAIAASILLLIYFVMLW